MSGARAEDGAVLAERMRAVLRLRPAIEHELRSGLNSIVLNVELLSAQIERLESFDDAEVGREAEVLREMVADLREGAAALTRRIEMTMRTVLPLDGPGAAPADLSEMVRNVSVFLAFEARLLGVRCETWAPGGEKAMPFPERRALAQAALLSLAAEALRFAAPGGTLRLSLELEEGAAVVEIVADPGREGEAATEGGGIEAICAPLGAVFDCNEEGEARRLRLRLPRPS